MEPAYGLLPAARVSRLLGHGPGSGKADGGIRPQTDVPAPSTDYDSLDPRFATGRGDVEVEAVAVSVPARFGQGFDCKCCKSPHTQCAPTLFPTCQIDT